ncbi:unnamed protein product [Ectocarpus sp. 6 AP-2014]
MIGFVGRKRSGKDTLAMFVRDLFPETNIMSFADPLKQACKHAYHLRDEQLDKTKDVIDPRWGMTPRDMMKSLGMKYFRHEDPHHWTKNMSFRIQGLGSIVISDVRFQNEAAFVKENGGVLIHVWRDMESNNDNDVSEQTTDEIACDHYIRNDGSLEDLRAKIVDVFSVL